MTILMLFLISILLYLVQLIVLWGKLKLLWGAPKNFSMQEKHCFLAFSHYFQGQTLTPSAVEDHVTWLKASKWEFIKRVKRSSIF